jgi:hypothetical protein
MSTERTYWFGGGLGDVVISIYWRTAFEKLLRETDAWVVHASVNPHVAELFRWLPNSAGLRLVDAERKRLQLAEAGEKNVERTLMSWAGRRPESLYRGDKREAGSRWLHTWEAPDVITSDVTSCVVIQPFAGEAGRGIPLPALRWLCVKLLNAGLEPILVTRDFVRMWKQNMQHSVESLPADLRRFQINHLSVPATLRLLQDARGSVGMHSFLTHAASCMGHLTLALQNEGMLRHNHGVGDDGKPKPGSWYFYYETYPHVTALPLTTGWETRAEQWVDEVKNRQKA